MNPGHLLCLAVLSLSAFERANGDDLSKLNDLFKPLHSSTEQRGLTLTGEYTGEVFGNLTGGIKTGVTYEGLVKLSLQFDLAKLAGWNGASIYGSMLYPHGEGLTDQFTGDFNRLSSIDAYDSSIV